ncbi:MAG: DEAD/DEAH box helicase [Bilifractor sp.]
MEFKPHAYQRYCIQRIIEQPSIGVFLDMGLGKTLITLTALHTLKYERWQINKTLIIAPKKVAENTWTAEQQKWDHLKNERVVVCLGSVKERIAALNSVADVYVINRENTQWIAQYYGHKWPFDVVVLDESSSFKNHRAKRFRALKAMLPRVSRLIELTGTPSPHGLIDLWAQVYLLDGGKRLGRTISAYRDAWFVPDKRSRDMIYSYTPRKGAEDEIYRRISDICISMKAADYLDLPDCVFDDIPVKLDAAAKRKYEQMERDMLLPVSDNDAITAGSAATLTGKLLQLCNGAAYDQNGNTIEIHSCKIEAFLETVEQLNGQHALVYYHFQHDKYRLLECLKPMIRSGLRVRVYESAQEERDWNDGKIDLLLAQPASCGYGLNLQNGGHHVIWFGLTWNLEEYQQANKRVHRQGQQYPVIIHRLIVQGGTDEDVIRSLEAKDSSQEALLKALKVRVEKCKALTAKPAV